jgi:hypothetical protein
MKFRLALLLFGVLAIAGGNANAAPEDTQTLDCKAGSNSSNCDECGAPMGAIKCCSPLKTCTVLKALAKPKPSPNKGAIALPITSGKPVQASH